MIRWSDRRVLTVALLLVLATSIADVSGLIDSSYASASSNPPQVTSISTFTPQFTQTSIFNISTFTVTSVEEIIGPDVQILNNTFNVMSGVPFSIVFNVTTWEPGGFRWAIATGDPHLPISSYQIQNDQVPLPSGVSVRYPDGTSFTGNQTGLYAVITVAGGSAPQGNLALELAVFQETEGVILPISLTVGAAPPSTAHGSGHLLSESIIVGAVIVIAVVAVAGRKRRAHEAVNAEAQLL